MCLLSKYTAFICCRQFEPPFKQILAVTPVQFSDTSNTSQNADAVKVIEDVFIDIDRQDMNYSEVTVSDQESNQKIDKFVSGIDDETEHSVQMQVRDQLSDNVLCNCPRTKKVKYDEDNIQVADNISPCKLKHDVTVGVGVDFKKRFDKLMKQSRPLNFGEVAIPTVGEELGNFVKPILVEVLGKVVIPTVGEVLGKVVTPTKGVRFPCHECPMTFTRKIHLIVHARAQCRADATFECRVCEKTFTTSAQLSRHFVNSHGASDSDDVQFMSKDMDEGVVKNDEGKGEDVLVTKLFGRALRSKITAVRRKHPVDKESQNEKESLFYQCDDPDIDLDTKQCAAVRIHDEELGGTHKGVDDEAKFTCPHCKKVFRCPTYLKNHVRSHNGAKPYVCHVCGKGFIANSNLKTHSRSHTGERLVPCSVILFC